MIVRMTEADARTLERQLFKLKPSSQELLKRMMRDGSAYFRDGKLRIKDGAESLALTFQFNKEDCRYCEREFVKSNPVHIYCCDDCQRQARREWKAEL